MSISAVMAYPENAGISQAPAANTGVGKATAGGSAKQASVGDRKLTETATAHAENIKIKTAGTETAAQAVMGKKKINISGINEAELLSMIKVYVNSMAAFADKTRNVHKVLKDTITNTRIVLNQYVKIVNSATKGKETKNTGTQTDKVPNEEVKSEGERRKKAVVKNASTDTPCWWPTSWEMEHGPANHKNIDTTQVYRQPLNQPPEDITGGEEFTVVNRKRTAKGQKENPTSKEC